MIHKYACRRNDETQSFRKETIWNKRSLLGIFSLCFVALMLVGFSPQTANAQGAPCYPDCPQSIWMPVYPAPAFTHVVTLNCGLSVTVHYRTRYACNTWYDLYVESFEFNSKMDGYICGQSMTMKEMMDDIMVKMIIDNPMNFPPFNPGDCEANWRVSKGSCWYAGFSISKELTGGPEGPLPDPSWNFTPGPALPCSQTTCCLDYFFVCILQDGSKQITHNNSSPGSCPSVSPPFGYFGCYPVCN